MAYLLQDDEKLISNVLNRKEFYWNKRWKHHRKDEPDIIPRFLLDDIIARSGNLRLFSYQLFATNYFNPNTPYKRLLMKWQTGTGKTIGLLSIAMNFINQYRKENNLGYEKIGSVFIIGFSERVFKNELLRFTEFGFLTRDEKFHINKLKRLASSGSKQDVQNYQLAIVKIKKRFSNRKGNGFFKFYGYKAFVNRIFVPDADVNITDLNDQQIHEHLASGKIKFNEELIKSLKNSLIICDEIHNVYNSLEKNNWGTAIQAVLDHEETCRAVFASATPLNNKPTEIIDLMNLLLPKKDRLKKQDFFDSEHKLKPTATKQIAKLSRGRVSYLRDVNPQYYPSVRMQGTALKQIPYLQFIRCPMSEFHYKTYKQVYTGVLAQDSQYLVDFALENPDSQDIGLFQTSLIKTKLASPDDKWQSKYNLIYKNERIMGSALHRKTLKKYSSKYATMIDELEKARGKVFIYHNVVHMSGVLFIEQVLLENGYIGQNMTSNKSSRCFHCGKPKSAHKNTITGGYISNADVTIEHFLSPKKNALIWMYNEHRVAKIIKQPDRYTIPHDSFHTDLLKGKSYLLNHLGDILDKLDNIPVYIHVPNCASRIFVNWLVTIGFILKKERTTYFIMKLPGHANKQMTGSGEKIQIIEQKKHTGHIFKPIRYIIVHSEIDKPYINYSIEKFNARSNSDGNEYTILLGSKIIKESFDIKAIRNVFIMGRPDNIPTLLQIRGRAVRKNSHRYLPKEHQHVDIKIFTTCLPEKITSGPDKNAYKLSYEEEKYKEKVHAYQVIQKIEKVLHENAIDSLINYDLINRKTHERTHDPLQELPFEPVIDKKFFKEVPVEKLQLSSFNAYHAEQEITVISTMIKRFFLEISSVWMYDDLLKYVRDDPYNYEPEYNTKLFEEKYFSIALSQLTTDEDPNYVEPIIQYDEKLPQETIVINKIYDTLDKQIIFPNGQKNIILPISQQDKQYFILFPVDEETNEVNIDIELPYRIATHPVSESINMTSFIQNKHVNFDYDDKKRIFINKYMDVSIENMENVICEYGTLFHVKFLEECIKYVFSAWTIPTEKSPHHDFYFKMLYYYDVLSLVIWVYTTKPSVEKQYTKYAIPVKPSDIKVHEKQKPDKKKLTTDDVATSGIINMLKTSYNRSSNTWIPLNFREEYNNILEKSKKLFSGRKKKRSGITKASALYLPIGHYISKFPKIYHPELGWKEDPTYVQREKEFIENDIIIGYDERSKTGVHIRFKLRKPSQNIKQHVDKRMIEKGAVCKSKSKTFLRDIAKKLNIENIDKINVGDLCQRIRSRLIRLELKERMKKSKIKYFYAHHEVDW